MGVSEHSEQTDFFHNYIGPKYILHESWETALQTLLGHIILPGIVWTQVMMMTTMMMIILTIQLYNNILLILPFFKNISI